MFGLYQRGKAKTTHENEGLFFILSEDLDVLPITTGLHSNNQEMIV